MEWLYPLVFFILLVFSAFFSSAETALISLNQNRLKHKASLKDRRAQQIVKLLNKPETLISTLLVGNNIVNVAIASLATVISSHWLSGDEQWIVLVSTTGTTLVLLTFGEIIPKSLGYRHRDLLSGFYARPVHFFELLFSPVVIIFSFLSRVFMGKAGHNTSKHLSLMELKHLMASEVEIFSHEPDILMMINEIIDLSERDVKSVMTSRLDMVAISANEGLEGIRRVVLEKRINNIPVFRDNSEQVIGVVMAKQLLNPLLSGKGSSLTLIDIMTPPLFVSEFSSLRYVLDQFRRHRTHFAVVIDEYGATLGVVTQSDIFQNILGNLDLISSPVQRVSRRVFRIMGNLAMDEAVTLLPVEIEGKKDYSTISGFFIYHYGRMPKEGARMRHNGAVWIVEKMEGLRIEKIKLILDRKS